MDKRELLKRWALAYTEPSLFYVPWGKRQNPYGEYITVQFETLECTFEDWQRDPVFAVYKADDTEYENPVYCTALYDNDNNLVRNGIIQRRFFYVCDEYGSASTRVILPSGKYKIKMLCSGGGMITNGIEEWEFTIERGTSGNPIYSGSIIDYSYRDVVINPFKGYKYLQIDCEAELIKTCKPSELVTKNVLQSFDVNGYGGLGYYKESVYTNYFPMVMKTVDDFIEECQNKFYLMQAVINEEIVDLHQSSRNKSVLRGKKKIVRNKGYDDYYNKIVSRYLQFTDYNKVDYIQYDFNDYDIECSFWLGHYGEIYNYDFYANCYPSEYLKTSAKFEIPNNMQIGNPELVSVDTTFENVGKNKFIKFNYKWKNKLSVGKYHGDSNPELMTNNYDTKFSPDRYLAYVSNELQLRNNLKNACTNHYKDENNYIIKDNSSWLAVLFSSLLTNESPNGTTEDLVNHYVELNGGTFSFKNEVVGTQIVPPQYKVIDLGVDWSGYYNYNDEDKWSGTKLYNSELEIYHPELIPKKAGET